MWTQKELPPNGVPCLVKLTVIRVVDFDSGAEWREPVLLLGISRTVSYPHAPIVYRQLRCEINNNNNNLPLDETFLIVIMHLELGLAVINN